MFGRRKGSDAADVTEDRPAVDEPGSTAPIRSVGIDLDERRPEREPAEQPARPADDTAVTALDGPGRDAEPTGPAEPDAARPVVEPTPDAEATQAVAVTRDLTPEERERRARSGRAVDDRPDPRRPSAWRAARSAVREFGRDQCTDLAAALTYYAVLSIFPAALALLSILGLVSDPERYVDKIADVARPLVSQDTLEQIRNALENLTRSDVAGVGLVVGVVVALFSASAYVGAFGRAMNRILEVEEGRPVWKLRPAQILVTLVTVLLVAVALVILVVSGPVARSVGDVLGLEGTAVTVWNIAKWPVLALIVIALVGILYRSTPNARQKFRWLSPGAFVAIVVWLLASAAFAFYVANVSSYDRTFGSVAGAVVALLWLWLTNLALLFGAELDSELERHRQLQGGLLAEVSLQLPVRDDRTIRKRASKQEQVVAAHREVRESFLGGGQMEDRPYR
ncbi:hypothetical protein GCM10011519_14970 [Marmoricola endophyticus]|uniref:YihY/virulence factor BrkB family protein n=1 Tax=Marmoricola endophyticus TaxID=2040280 RepID=A0A917BJQ7_9ACTN|nr:YhjD/YihY/BrkB family envelope integrity protein [Marmoricola endophyticus]GGF42146.1 hypothetical protein GCM10011519_14970 [Marmoricola endophyticus]